MNWEKINAYACMKLFKEVQDEIETYEEPSLIEKEHSIVYSDGIEELKISYRKIMK